MFSSDCCPINFNNTPIIITEPLFNIASIQEAMTEIFFEEYEVEHFYRTTAPDLAASNYFKGGNQPLCCVIIDMGYS